MGNVIGRLLRPTFHFTQTDYQTRSEKGSVISDCFDDPCSGKGKNSVRIDETKGGNDEKLCEEGKYSINSDDNDGTCVDDVILSYRDVRCILDILESIQAENFNLALKQVQQLEKSNSKCLVNIPPCQYSTWIIIYFYHS